MALTRRQKEVLDAIASFVKEHQYNPSFDELASALGLASLATVHKHILALESKQYLTRNYNRSRSVELTPKYFEEQRQFDEPGAIPLMGRIAAGQPVESFDRGGSVSFADFANAADTYALEVRGDSMIEDHICSGDFVLVQRINHVRNGDIVVALVEKRETTLKRFYDEGDAIRLQPANSEMTPIRVPKPDVEIQGKLLAVLRKYR